MAERSRVFDDQSDYYTNTDWLSQEEKEASALPVVDIKPGSWFCATYPYPLN